MGSSGLEPPTSCLSGTRSNHLSYEPVGLGVFHRGWRWWDSNPWPPACRAGALPTELHPHVVSTHSFLFQWASPMLTQNWTTSFFRLRLVSSAFCQWTILLRKEVIQPHLPIRLPCYDLTPIIEPTFDSCSLAVSSLASGVPNFHGLTGGVYKARERIHRGMLIRDY